MTQRVTESSDLVLDGDLPSETVFVLGMTQRSGTAFLRDILRQHPSCRFGDVIWEDYFLFNAHLLSSYIDGVRSRWNPDWDVDGLVGPPSLLGRCLGKGIEAFLRMQVTGRAVRENPSLADDPNALRDLFPPRLLAGTPSVRNLNLFRLFFPENRLIILVRDGRSVVESGMRSFGWRWENALHLWAEAAASVTSFAGKFNGTDRNCLITRYEDLYTNTASETKRIMEYLDLDPALYDEYRASSLPVKGSSVTRARSEEVHWHPEERDGDFDPLRRWSGWSGAMHRRFNSVCGGGMKTLGYDLECDGRTGGALNLFPDIRWRIRSTLAKSSTLRRLRTRNQPT